MEELRGEVARSGSREPGLDETIQRLLRTLRSHLGFDVAFVGQFQEGERIFRYVDSELGPNVIDVGGADPLEETYCHYVVRGELPELLTDPRSDPVAAELPATEQLPVGTHLSVPIRLRDGTLYGTFCCFATEVHPSVSDEDLAVVRLMAKVAADYLDEYGQVHRADDERRRQLRALVPGAGLQVVFQPIVSLAARPELIGVEALARFPTLGEAPDAVFADAARLGLGVELELRAIEEALRQLPQLPADVYLSVNASPETLRTVEFLQAARSVASDRLVVEITEHAAVTVDAELEHAVEDLTDSGVRLAIDDVGTGFSGLSQILSLNPDILKVDIALVRDVETSPNRQAMIAALVAFAARTETAIVAEGIETAEELLALRILGVSSGQGYHLAPPAPLAELAMTSAASGRHHTRPSSP